MGKVGTQFSMSVDGYIAYEDDQVGPLFEWYDNGPVEVPTANAGVTFHVSPQSAAYIREAFGQVGALITGRRLFDITSGWGGSHPVGTPVFVLTHSMPDHWPYPDAPFTFVFDGLQSAIGQAQAVAGDKTVAVAGPDVVRQCLDEGLLDEVRIDLVPVILGAGIPYFGRLEQLPVRLGTPEVVEGVGVTHLVYQVRHD